MAKKRLEQLRELSYEEVYLRRYHTGGGKEPEWETHVGSSGTLYHLRLETFWDIAEKAAGEPPSLGGGGGRK